MGYRPVDSAIMKESTSGIVSGSDPYKASMARINEMKYAQQKTSVDKEQEWASAFKTVQTVETRKRKEESEKIKKENMLKKFRELEL